MRGLSAMILAALAEKGGQTTDEITDKLWTPELGVDRKALRLSVKFSITRLHHLGKVVPLKKFDAHEESRWFPNVRHPVPPPPTLGRPPRK